MKSGRFSYATYRTVVIMHGISEVMQVALRGLLPCYPISCMYV